MEQPETTTWADLSPPQKAAIVVVGAVEVALTAMALVDLATRPRSQVRGPKVAWLAGTFVQPVGPIAYLVLGRRTR